MSPQHSLTPTHNEPPPHFPKLGVHVAVGSGVTLGATDGSNVVDGTADGDAGKRVGDGVTSTVGLGYSHLASVLESLMMHPTSKGDSQ